MPAITLQRLFLSKTSSGRIQFLRYLFVGGTSAVIDLSVYTALAEYAGQNIYLSALIGYTVGFAWNHFLSVLWIFESKHGRKKEIAMAYSIALGGLLWTELLLFAFADLLNIQHVLAKAMTQVIVLGWNFGMRKKFVFQ